MMTLMAMEDITARLNAAIKPGTPDKAAMKLRETEIEKLM